jgi:hypothetical protein
LLEKLLTLHNVLEQNMWYPLPTRSISCMNTA